MAVMATINSTYSYAWDIVMDWVSAFINYYIHLLVLIIYWLLWTMRCSHYLPPLLSKVIFCFFVVCWLGL